jgi:ABC-2 type transport system ATP-binding protein
MWDVIRELVAGGSTLLLTTQYLEEADVLADQIVVIDHGKAIARGTADELKLQIGGERVELVVSDAASVPKARQALVEVCGGGEVQVDELSRSLTVPAPDGPQTLMEVLRKLDSEGITLDDVGLRRPSLDDVFLTLTGHATVEDAAS